MARHSLENANRQYISIGLADLYEHFDRVGERAYTPRHAQTSWNAPVASIAL
ncbi:hypothetical protein SEA_DATBOI_167 [Gordonia phage DatBoi]|nr:hypothetical protein SEA_DATBOI_167 [Gordonia phage DatBoi]